MRRGIATAAAILIAVSLLCPHVFAATYTDDMANIYADQFREPFNMRYHYLDGDTKLNE